MATRAIKKLTKKDDLLELKKKNQELELNESDDDEEDADVELNFKPKLEEIKIDTCEMHDVWDARVG
jgi:hypothetical protein